jgi:hypothetical protein
MVDLRDDRQALTTSISTAVSAPVLFAVLLVFSLSFIAVTPIPAMSDYPNHLTRMYLLAADAAGQASPFYEVKWKFCPNLAMDLLAPWFAKAVGVELASRLFVCLAQCLVITGAVAIELAVKKRFEVAGFIALLFFCSFPFAWGFVNFQFGLGVALWGIAAWLALREKSLLLRFAVHLAFCFALFASHLLALGIYGFVLGLHECWRAWRLRTTLVRFMGVMLFLAAPASFALAAMLADGASVGGAGNDWDWPHKLQWPLLAINGYNTLLSGLCFSVLTLLVLRLKRAGGLKFESSGAWLAAGLGALYLAIPQVLLSTCLVDVRIVVAAGLILPGFIAVRFPDRVWRRKAALAVLAMIAANLALMAKIWNGYRSDYADIIVSFSRLDDASKILVAKSGEENHFEAQDLTPMYHAPVLAAHYANALVSTTMAVKGKQPLSSRPAFERFNAQDAPPATLKDLRAVVADGAKDDITDSYFRRWTVDFDYVYYVGAPIANPIPGVLEQLESGRRFTLYRIRKPSR